MVNNGMVADEADEITIGERPATQWSLSPDGELMVA